MSHQRVGAMARTLRVIDRDGDSMEFEMESSGHLYILTGSECIALDRDDLRAVLELIRENI